MDEVVSAGAPGRGQVSQCSSGKGAGGMGMAGRARLEPLHGTRTPRKVFPETAAFSWLCSTPLQGLTMIYVTSPLLLVREVAANFPVFLNRVEGEHIYS